MSVTVPTHSWTVAIFVQERDGPGQHPAVSAVRATDAVLQHAGLFRGPDRLPLGEKLLTVVRMDGTQEAEARILSLGLTAERLPAPYLRDRPIRGRAPDNGRTGFDQGAILLFALAQPLGGGFLLMDIRDGSDPFLHRAIGRREGERPSSGPSDTRRRDRERDTRWCWLLPMRAFPARLESRAPGPRGERHPAKHSPWRSSEGWLGDLPSPRTLR